LLASAEELSGHLREALKSEGRWILCADCLDGFAELFRWAAVLLVRLGAVGVNGDALLHYGNCEFFWSPLAMRQHYAFLTIPKSVLGVDEVNDFMTHWHGSPRTDGAQDILVLSRHCGDAPRMLALQAFLLGIREGRVQSGDMAGGN
jgi:hypothetical protein